MLVQKSVQLKLSHLVFWTKMEVEIFVSAGLTCACNSCTAKQGLILTMKQVRTHLTCRFSRRMFSLSLTVQNYSFGEC